MVACNTSDENTSVSKNSKAEKRKPAGNAQAARQEQENDGAISDPEAFGTNTDTTLTTAGLPDDKANANAPHGGTKTTGLNSTHTDNRGDLGNAVNAAQQEPDNPLRATASRDKTTGAAGNKAVMTFENTSFDFGSIVTGAKVQHEFTFTNTGAAPLIIHDASSSCGCTVPEIPLEPIAPGETSSILVKYDSTGKIGSQTKTVTIQTNGSPATYHVVLKGLVLTENMLKEEEPKETGE